LWSIFLKAPLEEPANPTVSPNPSKAPWYFLGLQEMLVYFDPWIAGVLLPTFIIIGLCAIPYIDRDTSTSGFYSFKKRRIAIIPFLFGLWVMWILLIIFGTFLRGPNWNFFGPFEKWDVHKLESLSNVNLSEYVWVKWGGVALPQNFFLRELPGIALTLAYLFVLPPVLAFTVCRKLYGQIGFLRYNLVIVHMLVMVGMIIKMALRWTMNLKYIVFIPEYFFNI
jgi:hypothetical protein